MSFPFGIYLAGGAFAFLTTLCLLPALRRWSHRAGFVDDPGHRKIHHEPVSLAGGMAVFLGFAMPLALGSVAVALGLGFGGAPGGEAFAHGVGRREWQLAGVILGAFGMVALGWVDDRHELPPRWKFAGQMLIALLVAASGVRITLFVPSAWFSFAVTVLWIVTVTNAFNFTDNMNGLCAGLGVMAGWACAWSAAIHGQYLVATLGFVVCGALLGFLPYNYPKASVFLGDSGSHLVGFLMSVLAILPSYYAKDRANVWAVFAPLVILAAPLADLASVVWIRTRAGLPFYMGDNNHFSHRLVRAGFSKPRAVLLLWLFGAVAAALGVWLP